MKTFLYAIAAGSLFLAQAVGAVTCAEAVYRAGCAGPNGAVVTDKKAVPPPRAVVVTPAPRPVVVAPAPVVVQPQPLPHGCAWVDGRRVCR